MSEPRFCELIRVSTEGQVAKDTPKDQAVALDRLRLSRPGRFVERIQEQVSGAADQEARPDLRRLAELCAAKAIDEVRVRHVDRLSRHEDPLERAVVLSMLRKAGAVIVDGSGAVLDPATMGGELTWVVQTIGAAEERKKIAERTLAGKARLVREGKLVGGRPPAGRTWDKQSGTWGIDEEGAALIRGIFSRCLEGWSLSRIAAGLNHKGIPTLGGEKEWTAAHVSRVLHDPAHKGEYVALGIKVRIPALVDETTWQAAAERLSTNNCNQGGRPAKIPALLRRLIQCGECEHSVYVDKAGKKGERAFYYVCPICRTYHRVTRVDAAVKERVLAWLKRPDLLKAVTERVPSKDDPAADVEAAKHELHALDVRQEKLARLATRGRLEDHVADKLLAEIQKSRAATQQELLAAQARVDAAAERERVSLGLEAKLEELRKGLGKKTTAEWRNLLEVLFRRTISTGVRLFGDGSIELLGTVVPNDEGAAALAKSARKPSTSRRSG